MEIVETETNRYAQEVAENMMHTVSYVSYSRLERHNCRRTVHLHGNYPKLGVLEH